MVKTAKFGVPGGHAPAGALAFLKDGDAVAGLNQRSRAGDAGNAGANDCDVTLYVRFKESSGEGFVCHDFFAFSEVKEKVGKTWHRDERSGINERHAHTLHRSRCLAPAGADL
ncbi:MAG: hypothetical protein ABI642_15085 [Polaromonas sp.]